MVGYGIAIITILLFCSCIIIKTRWSWFQSMPITIGLIVLILFSCGLFHNLFLGVIIVECLAVACLFYLFLHRKSFIQLRTHEFKCLLFIFAGVFILQIGASIRHGDELTHWMRTVQGMLNSNMLSNSVLTSTVYREYPPATALLEYFFVKLDGSFTPANHLRAMNIFTIAFLLPLISNIKNKMSQNWMVALIILFPTMFFYPYTESLVDCALGILLGCAIFIYFSNYNIKYKVCAISVASFICVLTKSSGIALMVIVIIIMSTDIIVTKKYKNIIYVIASITATLVAKISWSLSLAFEGTISYFNVDGINFDNVMNLLQNFKEKDKRLLLHFLTDCITPDPAMGLAKLSFVAWSIVLIGAGVYIYKKRILEKNQIIALEINMLSAIVVYASYLLLMYFFTWEKFLAEGSFYRYVGTCVLGFSLVMFTLFIKSITNIRHYKYVLIVMAMLSRPEIIKLAMNPLKALLSLFR